MAVGAEIRTQIKSVTSTKQITRAMEMVAASKMRGSQARMALGKPYARRMRQVIGHLALASSESQHRFLHPLPENPKRVGYIVVSSDRGLCGGLNMNLIREVVHSSKGFHEREIGSEYCLLGGKAIGFFRSVGGDVSSSARDLGEIPTLTDLVGVVKPMLDAFSKERVDLVLLASNEFVNTMTQRPGIAQLLPLPPDEEGAVRAHWDYIYEPDDAKALIDQLLNRYVESQIYQAVIENVACEQAARMVAMKSATDNAGDLIDQLQLEYNKARQAAITQELAEIVGGAAAV